MLGAIALGAARLPAASAALDRSSRVNSFGAVRAADPLLAHSRPDLRIPALAVDASLPATAPGEIFIGPYGPAHGQVGAVIADSALRSTRPFFA